jgi:hypothetical protein
VALSVRRREGVASKRAAGDEFALHRARLRLARWACIRRVLEGRRSGGDAGTLWVPLISVFPQVAESPYSPMCTCGQYPEIRFWDITPDKTPCDRLSPTEQRHRWLRPRPRMIPGDNSPSHNEPPPRAKRICREKSLRMLWVRATRLVAGDRFLHGGSIIRFQCSRLMPSPVRTSPDVSTVA